MSTTEDLYPNDSTYYSPKEPVEQVVERKKKKAQTLEALPILKELVERIDGRIAFYQDTRNIADEFRVKPDEFMAVHTAHAKLSEGWQQEKEWIEGLIEDARR